MVRSGLQHSARHPPSLRSIPKAPENWRTPKPRGTHPPSCAWTFVPEWRSVVRAAAGHPSQPSRSITPSILKAPAIFILTIASSALVYGADVSTLPPAATAPVDFARDIRPLLAEHCVKCHGPEKQKADLRLDAKAHAMRGGDSGKVIEPGKSAESRLIHLVAGIEDDKVMPPKGERLTAAQIGLLRAWIDQGAEWPADTKPARSAHWSLQPLRAPEVPQIGNQKSEIRNQIDAFIAARLAKDGLALSPQADRVTLIRRLTFDLTGLPPSPLDIEAFVKSESPRAYEDLVERLLASPQYGERWGRHWLDVARYTESQGFEYDRLRDNAWHYRDYVIRSFNDDKPYDRFMKEQVAGDVLEPVTGDGIVGASLLVCGPWDGAANIQKNPAQRLVAREDELEDLISVVGQSFLGLTINCVRCHTHKFDPIPHEEYYRIKSVFEGVKHGERPIEDSATASARAERRAFLKKEIGSADGKSAEDLNRLRDELAALQKPLVSYAGTRVQPEPTRRFRRGDVRSPDEIVTPGALSAIVDLNPDFGLAADAPEAERRKKFADWLADARNPLPARVMANRVWHLHFGQGIVSSPNDFGASGAKPTHPELLDWLAVKFIESGWSVKALHRLIVNSATYRQSSAFSAKASAVDAGNQLLWRFTPRRIEAEAVRDAMLAVSGQLNPAVGGPSFRPFTVTEFNAAFYHLVDRDEPNFNRRTVYRANVNSGKDPMLEAFDCPEPSVKAPRRGTTTTPLQALELMNNSFVQRQAKYFAERALKPSASAIRSAVWPSSPPRRWCREQRPSSSSSSSSTAM